MWRPPLPRTQTRACGAGRENRILHCEAWKACDTPCACPPESMPVTRSGGIAPEFCPSYDALRLVDRMCGLESARPASASPWWPVMQSFRSLGSLASLGLASLRMSRLAQKRKNRLGGGFGDLGTLGTTLGRRITWSGSRRASPCRIPPGERVCSGGVGSIARRCARGQGACPRCHDDALLLSMWRMLSRAAVVAASIWQSSNLTKSRSPLSRPKFSVWRFPAPRQGLHRTSGRP